MATDSKQFESIDITTVAEVWPITAEAKRPSTVGDLVPGEMFTPSLYNQKFLLTNEEHPSPYPESAVRWLKVVDAATGVCTGFQRACPIKWSSRPDTPPVPRTWGDIPRLPVWGVLDGKPCLIRQCWIDRTEVSVDQDDGVRIFLKSDTIPPGTIIVLPKV